jgi:glutamine amidotransferase
MCRLFGLSAGSVPVTARFWLLDAPDSLRQQSHAEPDGTGLGYFDADGRPHVDKQPLAAFGDRAFAREARTIHARTFVGHIRFASTGGLLPRNTHPFEQAGRLFAHNGVLTGLPELEARLGSEGMSLVRGDTDSERWFALITNEIGRAGGDVAEGVSSALDWVADNVPVLSLNFVLITADELWALRYPDAHDLHVLESAAGVELDQRSSHGTRIQAGTPATVVVATEVMDDDPGWRPLRSGELLHVDAALGITSTVLRSAPPTQVLTLDQLSGHARASQS